MPQNVFVLTGAGISAERAGTFRDRWRGDLGEVRSDEARDARGLCPRSGNVLDFYDLRRRNLLNAKPNAAHRALARLEQGLTARGGHLTLVTQNIDDLHERAGRGASSICMANS